MISVMSSNDCELGRASDLIDECPAASRVSDHGDAGISGRVSGQGATHVDSSVDSEDSAEARASSELQSRASVGGASARVSCGHEDISPDAVRAFGESDGRCSDTEMESKISQDKDLIGSREIAHQFAGGVDEMLGKKVERSGHGFVPWNGRKEQMPPGASVDSSAVSEQNDDKEEFSSQVDLESSVSSYESSLSGFDEYTSNDKQIGNMGLSSSAGYGFRIGDMVWGKVKSHPWWPGHIFNEAFASSAVRRTRREGHVLVAFFGDSSYGWFDPAELIHFDPHYAEKSRQMTSRSFARAVDEAVDEVSRRSGLGLACRCRNPYNFRPAGVQGYFAVDIPEFEPAGTYSGSQIENARASFMPTDTLSFIKQLAVAPGYSEQRSIDWIKNRATAFAYRKAVYEEFDETYAQAFGMQPVREAPNGRNYASVLQLKQPSRAPLSGPLVVAEALGSGKTSGKGKLKDKAKKDKYLFKRRTEPSNTKAYHNRQGHISSSSQPVIVNRSAGEFVLQRRAPDTSMRPQSVAKQEQSVFPSSVGATMLSEDFSVKTKEPEEKTRVVMAVDSVSPVGFEIAEEKTIPSSIDRALDIFQKQVDMKNQSVESVKLNEAVDHSECISQSGLEGREVPTPMLVAERGALPTGVKLPGKIVSTTEIGEKKTKLLKRPAGDMDIGKPVIGEKKKRRKKVTNVEPGSVLPQKQSAVGKDGVSIVKPPGNSVQTGLDHGEVKQFGVRKHGTGGLLLENSVGLLPPSGTDIAKLDLPKVLSDLESLALDPFHAMDMEGPGYTMQFILRFRSLVYQKSLALSPPSDTEPTDIIALQAPGPSGYPRSEKVRDVPSSRPPKPRFRSDDPTKAGRKRGPSDRQEEIAAKRLKKISNLKQLSAEKKANLKAPTPEANRGELKEQVKLPTVSVPTKPPTSTPMKPATAVTPAKPPNSTPVRAPACRPKMGPPVKVVEPTMLVMKFPPQTSLPSVMELKARFARFGPLDFSGTRVFWKTQTCRVVFKYKVDAQVAYKFATGNNSLFGNVPVKFHLRDVETQASEPLDLSKSRTEEAGTETILAKDLTPPSPMPLQRPALLPSVQLKSCLKKAGSEEAAAPAAVAAGLKGTPRVKFMLGGDESNVGEQLMVGNRNNNNNNNNASFEDGGTSVAMDFNSKNFHISTTPQPSLPFAPQLLKPPINLHHAETSSPRITNNYNPPPSIPSMPSIDISHQMLDLLRRCNDVVTNLKAVFGYMPYTL